MLVWIVSRGLCLRNRNRAVTGQENISARSGERQGILFWVRERVVVIITLLMKGWKKHFKSFVTDLNDAIIKKSFEQVENILVLRIKWVEKQPGCRYYIYHFGLHLFWQGNGIFSSGNFEKCCRSVTTKFKGRHTQGDMLLRNEVGTFCRNSLYDLPPAFRRRFGFGFVISSSHYFFTKMISFFKQEIE